MSELQNMTELGSQITKRRIELNLSLADVAGIMHINQRYLVAIENDTSEGFVSKAHYHGYLKQYLKLLQLDPPELPTEEIIHDQDLSITMPAKDKINPSFKFSLIIIALTILVYYLACNFLNKAPALIGDIYAS